ncbi:MAG TPA: aminotransferase class IV, partial [Methanobacteriaceae archaeon]|nr:aminotransferase class IV [Methanobacteriaceae archaeon]
NGITRDTVITLAQEMDLKVNEQQIPREMLYLADEVFLTGTAAEVTPIRSVDQIKVGKGVRGEITRKIQERFFKILEGTSTDEYGWLTYIK